MAIFDTVRDDLFEAIGIMGFGLYVLNYTLLTVQKVSSDQIRYFIVNFLAAGMVLIGLSTAFNLAAALIQIFWLVISITAIVLRLRTSLAKTRSAGLQDHRDLASRRTTETQIARQTAAPPRHGPRLRDGSLKTYYPGQGSGKRTRPPAMG